jgi:hypothetical protein
MGLGGDYSIPEALTHDAVPLPLVLDQREGGGYLDDTAVLHAVSAMDAQTEEHAPPLPLSIADCSTSSGCFRQQMILGFQAVGSSLEECYQRAV